MKLDKHLPSPNKYRTESEAAITHDRPMTTNQPFQSATTHDRAFDRTVDEFHVARSAAVMALGGVALIHLLELQGKLSEVKYLGVGYIGLIVGCVFAAAMLVHRNSRTGWIVAGGLALATFVGYSLTRTVGLPQSSGDIGNWLEPMGLASLFVEGTVVLLAAYALGRQSRQ